MEGGFFKIGKRDFTFIREMRVRPLCPKNTPLPSCVLFPKILIELRSSPSPKSIQRPSFTFVMNFRFGFVPIHFS